MIQHAESQSQYRPDFTDDTTVKVLYVLQAILGGGGGFGSFHNWVCGIIKNIDSVHIL